MVYFLLRVCPRLTLRIAASSGRIIHTLQLSDSLEVNKSFPHEGADVSANSKKWSGVRPAIGECFKLIS